MKKIAFALLVAVVFIIPSVSRADTFTYENGFSVVSYFESVIHSFESVVIEAWEGTTRIIVGEDNVHIDGADLTIDASHGLGIGTTNLYSYPTKAHIWTGSSAMRGMVIHGVTNQATPLQEWRTSNLELSTQTVVASVDGKGKVSATRVNINSGTTTPEACTPANRGDMVNIFGGAGVADTFQVCQKSASGIYGWVTKY